MGNKQARYTPSTGLGTAQTRKYELLARRLQRKGFSEITLNMFADMMRASFPYMPQLIIESLFLAFANSLGSSVSLADFFSTLAVIQGNDRNQLMKLLFHVYDPHKLGYLEKFHVEKVLKNVYVGRSKSDFEKMSLQINHMFRVHQTNQTTGEVSAIAVEQLYFKDFERYDGPLELMAGWIVTVFNGLFDALPRNFAKLNSIYGTNLDDLYLLVDKFGIKEMQLERLRLVFRTMSSNQFNNIVPDKKAPSHISGSEVSLPHWLNAAKDFVHPRLAQFIFFLFCRKFRCIWTLYDFISFIQIFGRSGIEAQIEWLCKNTFLYCRRSLIRDQNGHFTVKNMDSAKNSVNLDASEESASANRLLHLSMKLLILLLLQTINQPSTPAKDLPASEEGEDPESSSDSSVSFLEQEVRQLEATTVIPPEIMQGIERLTEVDSSVDPKQAPSLYSYVNLMVDSAAFLTGIKEIVLLTCCHFGIRPSDPAVEKDFVTELMLRWQSQVSFSSTKPYGPAGTEWCIVSKPWWDAWGRFVGHKRFHSSLPSNSNGNSSNNGGNESPGPVQQPTTSNSEKMVGGVNGPMYNYPIPEPKEPGEVDNWSILRKSGPKQLLQGVMLRQHINIVPPKVFHAVQSWYGGGPKVTRKVVQFGANQRCDLELFPLSLRTSICDASDEKNCDFNSPFVHDREDLYSRALTCKEVVDEFMKSRQLPLDRIRLWVFMYSNDSYSDLRCISDLNITLEALNVSDGYVLLFELANDRGVWPRDLAESRAKVKSTSSSPSNTSLSTIARSSKISDMSRGNDGSIGGQSTPDKSNNNNNKLTVDVNQRSSAERFPIRRRVGLENLGNTCYCNSSIQALFHLPLLRDYFLSNYYRRDMNRTNKMGYQGKLAMAFSKLFRELYQCDKNVLYTRPFMSFIASINPQFQGNLQHDAQEFLSFLLDGLSEDLNLVVNKPYVAMPDSDGRPDSEIAEIWWNNHLKRDVSVIQSLFMGQFRSETFCVKCHYSSVRFEPFNLLTVPLPETAIKSVTLHVVPLNTCTAYRVVVKVDKRSDFMALVHAVRNLNLDVINCNRSKETHYVFTEVLDSRFHALYSHERRLEMLRDTDNIFMYECESLHRGMVSGVKSMQLPIPLDSSYNFVVPSSGVSKLSSTSSSAVIPENSKETTNNHEESNDNNNSNNSNHNNIAGTTSDSEKEKPNVTSIAGGGILAENEIGVRIGFVQRRAKLHSQILSDKLGMEVFGVPFIEVFPSVINGADIYERVHRRFQQALYYPMDALASFADDSDYLPPSPYFSSSSSRDASNAESTQQPPRADSGQSSPTNLSGLQSVSVDVLSCGALPKYGFALRLVQGGLRDCEHCVRCNWMKSCPGCSVPLDANLTLALRDGDMISIDWHYMCYQEILNVSKLSDVQCHDTCQRTGLEGIPLTRCLDKFTEEESLEGHDCPKCKAQDSMKKHMKIWRNPPVLVVQLKRFQFDQVSRRKLTFKVDFPFENLDLLPYIQRPVDMTAKVSPPTVSSPETPQSTEPNGDSDNKEDIGNNIDSNNDSSNNSNNDTENESSKNSNNENTSETLTVDTHSGCVSTQYDLFSVVHHIGALSGGHYLTTARLDSASVEASTGNSSTPSSIGSSITSLINNNGAISKSNSSGNLTQSLGSSKGGNNNNNNSSSNNIYYGPRSNNRWYIFNDEAVTEIKDEREVAAASAYLLFYIRKDVKNENVEEIFRPYRSMFPIEKIDSDNNNNNDTEDNIINSPDNSPVSSKAEREQTNRLTGSGRTLANMLPTKMPNLNIQSHINQWISPEANSNSNQSSNGSKAAKKSQQIKVKPAKSSFGGNTNSNEDNFSQQIDDDGDDNENGFDAPNSPRGRSQQANRKKAQSGNQDGCLQS